MPPFSGHPPDCYEILGLAKDAERNEIRSAYRKLVLKCHPDKFPDEELKAAKQVEFQRVIEAFDILSNDDKRAQYNEHVKIQELREKKGPACSAPKKTFVYEVRTAKPRTNIDFHDGSEPIYCEPPNSTPSAEKNYVTDAEEAEPRSEEEKRKMRQRNGGEILKMAYEYVRTSRRNSDRQPSDTYSKGRNTQDPSSRIEDEIKARNAKARENLRQGSTSRVNLAGGQGSASTAINPKTEVSADGGIPKPKVVFTTVPPEQLGMKIMNPETKNVSVDIIAVHGLGAIPEITWKEKHSGKNWLSDAEMLPKAVPEARIMRFGYDSLWLGKEAIRTRLTTIANKLLLALNNEREDVEDRPLVFVGHCFGGLVIERALISAKLREVTFPGILASAVGVVFLGTPHRGSKSFLQQSALLAAIAEQSDLHGGIEPEVLDAMKSDSGAALDVAEDFVDLCRDRGLEVACFFEQRKSNLGKVVGRTDIQEFIVPEESATLEGLRRWGLPLDHFSLNKFSKPDDGNFREVCGEITRMYRLGKRNISNDKPPSDIWGSSTRAIRRSPASFSTELPRKGKSEEEELIKKATKELNEEEFEKRYQARVAADAKKKQDESAQAEAELENKYKERLVANMTKYGVPDSKAIVDHVTLPKNKDLKPQEIKDKMHWYKNRVKRVLLDRDIPDGQVDEILNDTGDTVEVDGANITFTIMARKWISMRTLERYDVPYELDKNDSSIIIIQRWVPEYEKDFLWDHTYNLRYKGKGVPEPPRRPAPPKMRRTASGSNTPTSNLGSRTRSYDSVRGGYTPEGENRGRRNSGTLNEKHRQKSNDSMFSTPNAADIEQRRRHSRTMSGERPSSRKQNSNSTRTQRESSSVHAWASDGEIAPKKSSGIFSGIKDNLKGRRTRQAYVEISDSSDSEPVRRSTTRPRRQRERSPEPVRYVMYNGRAKPVQLQTHRTPPS